MNDDLISRAEAIDAVYKIYKRRIGRWDALDRQTIPTDADVYFSR